ncbi:DNA polymerase III subunit alpha [Desulfobacterales bacterium HSG16]|nr:DNA polymerase III subunit alpha [Desulfobacterales bacterium HSG16]
MAASPVDFVHLHVHTQYSLLDGAIRLNSLMERAGQFGMKSVAITDHGTMFGALEFYEVAKKAEIRPVIGCECYVAPRTLKHKEPKDKKSSHLVLLAKNRTGYKNLCKLVSIAQLEGFYYKPRIDREILQQHSEGLIALSACLQGEVARLVLDNKIDKADEAARFHQSVFGEENFYLEVQNNGLKIQEDVNEVLFDMSKRLSIPLVATNDCHYLDQEDVRAHDVLLCIQTGKTVYDKDRFQFGTDQLYFKSGQEMAEFFKDHPESIANTVEIANRCEVEFDFSTYHFPKYDADSNQTADEIFDKKVRQGFDDRMAVLKKKDPNLDEKVYNERLEYEVSIIKNMGFPGYFLIVADFIQYGKENGVPVGPGRGSAAGSIVAYSMGITDLDPISHGLIFERFLNPSRISMPDIDVDFCINGREKVFKYVIDRYGGGDYVAQIITFGKMKTRAVIRDVGRALDIPLREVDAIAKMVPEVLNISLKDALEQEPKIKALADEKSEIDELIKVCKVLEGLTRHASTHAAGVVIGDKPLVEYLPLYKGKKGEVVTQFDMTRVEKIGLVKFDFLGLRNLTVIENALNLIQNRTGEKPDLIELDFDDKKTYDLLSGGDTTGVFQLESSGMKELLMRMKPRCFDDVTALVALYRPGPLDSGMVDDFVERKHGRKKVEYIVPELEQILKETYGVIVYQEQVMKIAGVLASYSMADADGLRKAMGKKIASIMAEHRKLFMKGSVENNIPADKAKMIFDLMEKFGGYGFNKSHSAAYALIAFQTAYLKAHFPVEFMASLLTSEMHSTDGVVKYIAECRSHAIEVLPPDVNESNKEFTVIDGKIRFGLMAVKNVGEGAIESIIETRKENPFADLFDFCKRVDLKKVNKRVVEGLIRCGAFDSTKKFRSRMLAAIEDALDFGQRIQKEQNDPQMGLFDMGDEVQVLNAPTLPTMEELDEKELLAMEKEALGFFITGHPLSRHENLLQTFTTANTLSIKEQSDKEAVRIGGIITSIKKIKTRKNEDMAFITTEDMHGSIETVVFSSVYDSVAHLLLEDGAVLIEGQIQKDDKSLKILADKIVSMDKAEETWTASMQFHLDINSTKKTHLQALRDLLQRFPGTCQAFIHLEESQKSETVISVSDDIRVSPGQGLTREVNALFGYNAVTCACKAASFERNSKSRKSWNN